MEQLKDILSAHSFIALYFVCKRYGYDLHQVAYSLTMKTNREDNELIYSFNNTFIMRERETALGKQFMDAFNVLIQI